MKFMSVCVCLCLCVLVHRNTDTHTHTHAHTRTHSHTAKGILTDFLRQRGELVDVLTCVLAAGHAEAKLKVKALEQLLAEVVSLDHAEVVELYLKASNNLGVTLARLAERSGDSALQGQALAHFSESLRAWDALTRNQETMVRLEGSNLAEQNIKYLTYPVSAFEPTIYGSIPRVLYGERMLEQSALN